MSDERTRAALLAVPPFTFDNPAVGTRLWRVKWYPETLTREDAILVAIDLYARLGGWDVDRVTTADEYERSLSIAVGIISDLRAAFGEMRAAFERTDERQFVEAERRIRELAKRP